MNTDHLWLYHFLSSLMDYTIHSIGYVHKRNVVIMIHTFTWLILKWFETWYVTNTKYPRTHNSELVHNISVTLIVAWKLFEKVCGTKTSIAKYIYIKVLNDLHEYFFHFFFLLKRQNSFFFIIVDSYIMRFLRVYTN